MIFEYLGHLLNNITLDIYKPQKDEIILGLIYRIIKLIVLLWKNELSWTLDIGQILVRCSAESCIVLNYLLKKDSEELFESFIQFGEGRDKLLLLKFQEYGDGLKGIHGESFEDLDRELGGGFYTEMKDINLGNWSDKNIRDMAIEIGMKKFYDLIYDRASEYVHGTWNCIKYSHLIHCLNPLHGFHKIPNVHNPVPYYNILPVGLNILKRSIDCCLNHYNIQKIEQEFKEFQDAFNVTNESNSNNNK